MLKNFKFRFLKAFTLLEVMIGLSISVILLLLLVALQAQLMKAERYKYVTAAQHNTFLKLQSLLRDRYHTALFSPNCLYSFTPTVGNYEYDAALDINNEMSLLKQKMITPISGGQYEGESTAINTDLWPIAKQQDFSSTLPNSANNRYWLQQSDYLEITFLSRLSKHTLKSALQTQAAYFTIPRELDHSLAASSVYFLATDCEHTKIFATKREMVEKNTRFFLSGQQHDLLKTLNENKLQIYQLHMDVLSITKDALSERPYFKLQQYGNARSVIKIANVEQMHILYHLDGGALSGERWRSARYIDENDLGSRINGLLIIPLISKKLGQTRGVSFSPALNQEALVQDLFLESKTHEFIRPFIMLSLHSRLFL